MKWCFLANNASFLMEFLGKIAYQVVKEGDECIVVIDSKVAEYKKRKYFPSSSKFILKTDWYLNNYNPNFDDFGTLSWKPLFTPFYAYGKKFGYKNAKETLSTLYQFFNFVFEKEKPDIIVSESPSGLFGEIAYYFAKQTNTPFFGFMESRIIERVDIYDLEFTDSRYKLTFDELKIEDISKKERDFIKDYIPNFIAHKKIPAYEKFLKIYFSQLGLILHYYNRARETGRPLLKYLFNRGSFKRVDSESEIVLSRGIRAPWEAEKRQFRIISQKRFFQYLDERDDFFLYPLHLQPEAATSVWATYYYNQLDTIRNIAFTLPFPYKLYVKEHPSAVGMQSNSFYSELKEIPNVVLIAPDENVQNLIKKSSGVIVLTSTVGMEAVLAGKPTYILGNAFYTYHPLCRKVQNFDDLRETIQKDIDTKPNIDDLESINIRFITSYMRNTLSGSIFAAISEHDTNDYSMLYGELKNMIKGNGISSASFENLSVSCPICKKNTNLIFLQNHKNIDGRFSLYECENCVIQFWDPLLNPGNKWHGYEGRTDDRKAHDILKPKIRREYHKKFLQLHGKDLKGKKILDVGCGTGEFIAAAQEKGAEVWGVDFDRTAVSVAKEQFNLSNVYAMSAEEFFLKIPSLKFDYITCFEVIEHVDDPLGLVESFEKLLKPKGTIVISTPSRERVFVNLNTWDFPPNHLIRWNEKSLLNLFNMFGFGKASVRYVEQFRLLLEAMNGKFRFGLLKKAANISGDKKTSTIFTKIVVWLALIKEYLIGLIPATLLSLWGIITGRKNGVIIAEFKR